MKLLQMKNRDKAISLMSIIAFVILVMAFVKVIYLYNLVIDNCDPELLKSSEDDELYYSNFSDINITIVGGAAYSENEIIQE